MTQLSKGRRRGDCFTVRVTPEERVRLEALRHELGGPRALGPWLLWHATHPSLLLPAVVPPRSPPVLPELLVGNAGPEVVPPPAVVPELAGIARPGGDKFASGIAGSSGSPRVVLDLCGGSGAWSRPYREAGYDVRIVTLPTDVRTYVPPANVWGVLAAPPCTEFSLAKNGQPRDFVEAMACVNACMRIVLQCRPRWWALENPTGLLGDFLGTARAVFEPCDFGDPWTKRTALWGDFAIPVRGPFVEPTGSAMDRRSPAARAVTPPGFARAFFEANP